MTGLTRQLAEFVAGARDARPPAAARDIARTGTTDCIGVMIAGAAEEAPQIVARMVADCGAPNAAPLLPSGRLVSPLDAALCNGVAAHVLDYDDVGMDGHPSIVLVPAIFAAGWADGASGRDALDAYVVGYEVWAALKSCEPGQLHDRGFHPTALWGTVAAAAAVAFLRGLDADRCAHALGIAASLASGLVANFGTMTKSLHAGRAAQSGVLAVDLAAAGFTAAPDVFEHQTGYLRAHAVSAATRTALSRNRLGEDWQILTTGINIKRYPVCYSTHRPIDAMLGIVERHAPLPAEVAEIRVGAGVTELLMLRNHAPKTALEAKFSMEFAMASALIAGNVGLAQLDDGFVQRADVAEAMTRVNSRAIHDGIAGMPDSPPDTVEVVLRSGQVLDHAPVQFPKGSWQRPLSRDEQAVKFLDCATRALPADQAEDLFARAWDMAAMPSLHDLSRAIAPTI